MPPDSIPVNAITMLECRSCGAGAPVDEHFCPQCSRILALGRHGDYFGFFGLDRRLNVDLTDLERRFRDLSRKFHPDFYYNAPPAERLASLERASYLNDAYRALRNPFSRIEHLLAVEGLPAARSEGGSASVPPSLLEEVFALNEQLDEIRESREAGGDPDELRVKLERAREPIDLKREGHEREVEALCARWDAQLDDGDTQPGKRATLDALRERLLERNYINNLLAAIDREAATLASGGESDSGG